MKQYYFLKEVKILIFTIICALVFGLVVPEYAFAATASKQQDHQITFAWCAVGIPLPQTHVLTVNTSEEYTVNSDNSHTINKIETFTEADKPNNLELWQITAVITQSVGYDNTNFSRNDLTYDGNIWYSPDWIWDNRYKIVSVWKVRGTAYTIYGTGGIALSYDCIPNAFEKKTQFNVTP
ncbi:MAG: hypothetical protein PHN35_05980 [Clostridia bacterium]|nr:hypothetical protein [Clostridia bacterium]MDD4799218.1 hypothetical protein [Clostridia bacterium]